MYHRFESTDPALVWSCRPVATLTLLGIAPNSDCCPASVVSEVRRQFSWPGTRIAPSEVTTLSRAQTWG
jgi:hypothetical protein